MTIITNLLKIIAIILLSVNGLFVYFIIIIIKIHWKILKLLLTRLFLLAIIFCLRPTVYVCNVIVKEKFAFI